MSETKEMLGYLIEIRDSVNRIEQRMDKIEERMDKIEQRVARIEERMDKIEQRMDGIEERIERFEEYVERRFKEMEEKISVMEFALETEIQKVYEVALVNQSDIKLLMVRQKWYYNDVQTRQQVDKLNERVNTVEGVVQSHSEAIQKLWGFMA